MNVIQIVNRNALRQAPKTLKFGSVGFAAGGAWGARYGPFGALGGALAGGALAGVLGAALDSR